MLEKQKYYVASISYGKDSLAMLLKILEKGYPLDEVMFCEVMFDDNTSGLHPKQLEFIKHAKQILLEKYKVNIVHLKAIKSYKEQFYTKYQRGGYIGKIYGFPLMKSSWCNGRLKLDVISKYINMLNKKFDVYQYIGIAVDEPKRIKDKPNVIYPLVELGITEEMAKDICIANDLYSPIYNDLVKRDGCWFCHKQSMASLRDIYTNYPNLWNNLRKLQSDCEYPFKPRYSIFDLDKKFKEELNI